MKSWVLSIFLMVSASAASAEKKYVDMHAHVACYGVNSECYIGEMLKEKWLRHQGLQFLFNISEGEVRRHGGDEYVFQHISNLLSQSTRVKSSVLLAFDQVHDEQGRARKDLSPFYVPNDFVAKGTKRFENLHYAASVHPFRKGALQELERVSRQGAVFNKLIPSIHRFEADDPRLDSYWRKMAELKLPLLIHLDDEGTFGDQAHGHTGAYKIERALRLGVIVVAAHVSCRGETETPAGPVMSNYEQLRSLALKYQNLYADISALPQAPHRRYVLFDIVDDPAWKGRLLYGSDFPLNHWVIQSMYSFSDGWDRWRENGVDPKEFWRVGSPYPPMEQRWDRDLRLKEAFGVKEEIFLFTEIFLRRFGRLK